MNIEIRTGRLHALKLLEDGGEPDLILETLTLRPPQFAEGMRQILTNPDVLETLAAIRSGKYHKHAPPPPRPGEHKLPDGQWECVYIVNGEHRTIGPFPTRDAARNARKELRAEPPRKKDNPYPGLLWKDNRWVTRIERNGKQYRTRSSKDREEAIQLWQELMDRLDVENPKKRDNHGARYTYEMLGCRCDLCTEANKRRRREQRLKQVAQALP